MAIENSETTTSMARRIWFAARNGYVDQLDKFVQQHGKVILSRFSLASFSGTPLHLAALVGHATFVERLLELRPELASEQDSEKCTPLHLAAANGHVQVVRELLVVDKKALLMQDQEGRLPLHLAAMGGHVAVAQELLKSGQSAEELLAINTIHGDRVLHLCIKYNHLPVLKVLVEAIGDDEKILMMADSRGNTILQLAVMLKQIETVRFLVKLPVVRIETGGSSTPWDYKILVIGKPLGPSHQGVGHTTEETAAKAPEIWMKDAKGWIMTVSTLIATVTFAAAVLPPGGVWGEDVEKSETPYCDTNQNNCFYPCDNSIEKKCWAGSAVLSYYFIDDFVLFMKYNTISFTSSLMVVFLLLSGFPLSNKYTLWILSLALCLSISCLGLTFLKAMWLVLPHHFLPDYNKFKMVPFDVWVIMVGAVGMWLLVRASYWFKRHSKIAEEDKLTQKTLFLGKPYAWCGVKRIDSNDGHKKTHRLPIYLFKCARIWSQFVGI
ncbi:hypothetical protein SAY87_027420 [Trapa incisa]|uniref:PGG domain-containing protein n=1 Tax=Trapa incisa TaxID=236973 RepID=A0AAN7GRR3_9MYRT|nr:hypothetical protein SAY87_027420 [Trapa incisa]